MSSFDLFVDGKCADIIVENTAHSGVRRVAGILADDIALVTGVKPDICQNPESCKGDTVIIAATAGHSPLSGLLCESGLLETACIDGKRECYIIKIAEQPFRDNPHIKKALLIIGSDKRGTIYGMFRLSELCGVSPLVFWGDAVPEKRSTVQIELDDDFVSKEPSVKYRGFFINDEWPAFGKWCKEHYGDVNAKAYDVIFQLLLRLKGNYLWPAMWDSSFSEDGPGLENARLADEYGVIMGASHHEPMCRAGVEWQRQYTKYGDDNTWSFVTNSDAITEFWKDGIIRNKDFENIITIGMRGESDSLLMGKGATIQDNIDVLKKALCVQNRLIKEHLNPDLKQVPRMFAIYKEVEDFYFGIDGCDGLRGFEELEDVILLYSDDNHGNLRAIPQITESHSGGYGLYYHFDYHGGPHSFEWLNHTNLAKAWEQLTMAYEHGIREMWIVNVGDIKANEYTLSYFMDLAYDYDKWGISNTGSAFEYTRQWLDVQFGAMLNEQQKQRIHEILDAYTLWSTVRIPESMNPGVFKNSFGELDRTFDAVSKVLTQTKELRGSLPSSAHDAFDSMVYYPVTAFFSSMLVNLTAGLNHIHARRRTLVANQYANMLKDAISKHEACIEQFHGFKDGKWNHMMESAHMCFRTWDDNDWAYPVAKTVTPIPCPKIVVSFRGNDEYNLGHHWQDTQHICNDEMTRPDVSEVTIDIDSRSGCDYRYTLSCDRDWLTFSQDTGVSKLKESARESVRAYCSREKLKGTDTAVVQIDFEFDGGIKKQAFLDIKARNCFEGHPGAFFETCGYICINAEHYHERSDIDDAGWRVVKRLGRVGDAVKSLPATKNWESAESRPFVRYDFVIDEAQDYVLIFYLSPRNPMIKGEMIRGCYSINDGAPQMFDILGGPKFKAYETDASWSYAVTNNIIKTSVSTHLSQGLNSLKFYATAPNVILENIVIHPADKPIASIHLAPPESCRYPLY